MNKPKIITLCGSTKFKKEYEKVNIDLSLQGNIVISVVRFGHVDGLDMNSEDKMIFDYLHLRKIDISDEIFVINVGGYIGESTMKEMIYAKKKRKKISFLEPLSYELVEGHFFSDF